jgi:hypothetical protein
MKTSTLKGIFKTFMAVATVSVVMAACSKDKYEPQRVAGLYVVSAFPDTLSLDFVLDQNRVNEKGAFKYNTRLYNTINSGYLNLYPGLRQVGLAKRNGNKFITTKQFNFSSGLGYTLFVLDTLATNEKRFLVIEDDITAPEANKAKVRFVNVSKDAGALSLAISGKETDLFTNKAYAEYSPYTAVDPADAVTFTIKQSDGTKATVATLPNIKIQDGRLYTIYAKGLKTAVIDSLKTAAGIYNIPTK